MEPDSIYIFAKPHSVFMQVKAKRGFVIFFPVPFGASTTHSEEQNSQSKLWTHNYSENLVPEPLDMISPVFRWI